MREKAENISDAFWVFLATLILDQLSKVIVSKYMRPGDSISVIGDLFKLTYVYNEGAAFGLSLGGNTVHIVLSAFAIIFVCFLIWRPTTDRGTTQIALSMILGGALGNLIDRIRLSRVIDFLDVGINDVRWYIFNMADMWVTAGVILLAAVYFVRKDVEDGEKNRAPSIKEPVQRDTT